MKSSYIKKGQYLLQIIEVFNNRQYVYVQSKQCSIEMTKMNAKTYFLLFSLKEVFFLFFLQGISPVQCL